MKKIFGILIALALVLSMSLVAVPAVASPADGDVTIVVQDQAGSPIEGATARLLFYGGGKGGYSMDGKTTDATGSATFTATEIATWLAAEGYDPSSQIYAQPGAKVETDSAYGKVRTVDPTTGFPCIPYNTPDGGLVPKSAMSFTYKMIMMSTEPVQTVWDDPTNNFTVTATLADSLSVTPDVTKMRLIRNLVGGQPPAPGGSDDDWYMWNGTAYERWKGIATVDATATGASVSATFSQGIFSDWLVGNKIVVKPEFGVNRTVDSVSCIDDYYAVDILRPSSYIHPAQINDTDLFYPTIQDAIDAAVAYDTINVDDGTYTEQLVIDVSGLTVQAASSPVIDGGGMLGPGVHITAADVTFQGFTVTDFTCTPTSGIGAILVEGDGAIIDDNEIYDITSTTEDPAGIGIDVHASNVEVTINIVHDVGSIGIRVRHDWDTAPTVSNNVLLEENEVYRTANSGVLVTGYAKGVTIRENEIYESLEPTPYSLFVHYGAEDVLIEDNIIRDPYDSIYGHNVVLAGCDNVTISGNAITGATSGKSIYLLSDYSPWVDAELLSTNVNITNNDIQNGKWGVRIVNAGATDPSQMAATTTINFNNISGNSDYGVENTIDTPVDATYNWWGHATGADHTSNPHGTGGGGDTVSDNVDFIPWYATSTATAGTQYVSVEHSGSSIIAYSDTIQGGIDAALSGDTIMVAAGTYNGFEVTKDNLTIQGPTGAVVSGAAPGRDAVVYIGSDVDSTTIQGLTIDATGVTSGIKATESGTYSSIAILGSTIKDFKKGGIVVQYASAVQFEDNIIDTTDHSQAPNGIQIGFIGATTGTTGTVNDNQISGCHWDEYDPLTETYEDDWTGSGILVIDTNSALEISDNEVQGCDVGMDIESGTPTTITGNDVHDNSYGFVLWNAAPTINFNNIYQNALCGVYRAADGDLTGTVDATYNWWGSSSGPYHATLNPGGTGDAVSDYVDFEPWLVEDPTVTTQAATEVSTLRATLNMNYTVGGYSSVQVRFACKESADTEWSYTDWVSKAVDGTHAELLTHSVFNINNNTDYDFKAQLKYSDTVYGETVIEGATLHFTSDIVNPCFIATAAYGTPTAEQIDVLREFRDVVLLESTVGSQFVSLYYQLSPPVADFIAGNSFLRTLVRELLVDPIVWVVEATGDMWQN